METINLTDKSPVENLPKEQKLIVKQAFLNIEKRKSREYPPTAKEVQDEINSVVSKMETTPNDMVKQNYDATLKSGMFFEFYPELTGNWAEDLGKWANISGKIIKKPKPAEAKLLYPFTCKHSEFFQKAFTNLANEREYWLFTEVFCYLHNGKDYCNCNK